MIVLAATGVAGGALFVEPSITGLSPLSHLLVVGVVAVTCSLAILGPCFRYTAPEEPPSDDEWRYDS